jgi:cobalt-zinc-cadmium efflux system protein
MSHHHDHPSHQHAGSNIVTAFWLNTGFALVELAGGLMTQSVAVLSNALHDFGDSLSIGLAYYFHGKSSRRRDANFSYGYKRFSLLGAFINSIVLVVGSGFILQQAILRLFKPEHADAKGMLYLSLLGIMVNGIAMLRLRSGHSVNEKVVSLHFLEDVLGWVAVLAGSVVMMFYELPGLDPVLSIAIACYILLNVLRNLRQAFRIVLQGIPEGIDIPKIEEQIRKLPNVLNIHDLHTWTMDGSYNIMTLHLVVPNGLPDAPMEKLKEDVRQKLSSMNIQHVTMETEHENDPCALKDC